MPSIAVFHPQIVHFVIAILVIGVVFRLVSLSGRFAFTAPAATTLIVIGTLASVPGMRSTGPCASVPDCTAPSTSATNARIASLR